MGGRLAPEWVAGINRNGWPASPGIAGRNRAEYASTQKLRFTPTNRQKLEAQKTCDIIHPVSLVSGADLCYIYMQLN
jgi:hypothetical protein